MMVTKHSFARLRAAILSAVALCVCAAASGAYEPGANAAILSSAGGGAAATSAHYVWLNPAAAAFAADGFSSSAGYKKFFAGVDTSASEGVPGYILPDVSETMLEVLGSFGDGLTVGAGFYSLGLKDYFSRQNLALYAACPLGDSAHLSSESNLSSDADLSSNEGIVVGVALKQVSVSYVADEYTSDFFSVYSGRKSALTLDAGAIYTAGRLRLGVVGRNLIPADLGIYESAPEDAAFLVGVAAVFRPYELRLDFAASGAKGFTEAIPSVEIKAGAADFRLGVNSSQAAAGATLRSGDIALTAAFIYPYAISGGFGDFAANFSYRIK